MEKRIEILLDEIRRVHLEILGERLTGIYVHGSLAFGCFRWETSDVDFLTVVNGAVTTAEKRRLLTWILSVREKYPPKGIEMSIVEERYCRGFLYPTPYLFHFSEGHLRRCLQDPAEYCETMHGTDPDLAAHFTVTRAVGFPLYGPPAAELFAPVPEKAYFAALLYDVENMEADIAAHPVYCVLNLCRVLAFCREGTVLSKAAGGVWGMTHLEPVWHDVIRQAAEAYKIGGSVTADAETLRRFAARCIGEIRNRIE
ncbi:MAG: DUF4111 domain-containing protein [Clostridia bacterium]|nr:DUF4111 domain-containing protein [Clostridia bacterium]